MSDVARRRRGPGPSLLDATPCRLVSRTRVLLGRLGLDHSPEGPAPAAPISARPMPRLVAALAVLVFVFAGCKETNKTVGTGGSSPLGATQTQTGVAGPGKNPGAKQTQLPSPSPLQVKGSPLAEGSLKPTAPGKYSADAAGVRKFRDPATSQPCFADDHPISPFATTVFAPDGGRQGSYGEARYESGFAVQTSTVLEFAPTGVSLVRLRQVQYFPGGLFPPFEAEFEPPQPVRVFPANPKAGETWSFHLDSKDNKVHVDSSNKVDGLSDDVALSSGSVKGVRLKGTSHVTGESPLGPLDLTDTTTTWVSVELRLILKTIADSTGTVGTCKVDGSHLETTLRSTSPESS